MPDWPYPDLRHFNRDEIAQLGFDHTLVGLATGSNDFKSKAELSKILIAACEESERLSKAEVWAPVRMGKAIPDSVICGLAAEMVCACAVAELPPPVELAWLVAKTPTTTTGIEVGSRRQDQSSNQQTNHSGIE